MSDASGWLAYCRPGFESECAQELTAFASARGVRGHARTERGAATVEFVADEDLGPAPAWQALVFSRQSLELIGRHDELDPRDRLGPLLACAAERRYADLWVETADSEGGGQLASLARALEAAAVTAARRRGLLDPAASARLHLCLLSGTRALVARADLARSAPWRQGIPRLKLARDAPSRSALKLEEAWLTLMDEAERTRWLAPGLTAVDLGAAPGGWTWQLARRAIRVTAIDNGPLDPRLLDTGLVTHRRADGFRWRPPRPVDWVLCDMVEQPARVAALIGEWLVTGSAQAALVNLKLPMKQRWRQAVACLDGLRARLDAAGRRFTLRAKQLYHDREEITVLALPRRR